VGLDLGELKLICEDEQTTSPFSTYFQQLQAEEGMCRLSEQQQQRAHHLLKDSQAYREFRNAYARTGNCVRTVIYLFVACDSKYGAMLARWHLFRLLQAILYPSFYNRPLLTRNASLLEDLTGLGVDVTSFKLTNSREGQLTEENIQELENSGRPILGWMAARY
jgi:hypothetical protein